jgi:hypothetical protein
MSIELTESFTEIKNFSFIIKACRLKPQSFLNTEKNVVKLYRWWYDDFGNSLKLDTKVPKIIYNDLNLDRSRIFTTDLYYGLPISKITKFSKLTYICAGKDEDNYKECGLITFLGDDNYLRSYSLIDNEYEQVSPLTLGIDNLMFIANNKNVKYFCSEKKLNIHVPCVLEKQWLSYMPVSDDFSYELKDYDNIYNIFKKEKQ